MKTAKTLTFFGKKLKQGNFQVFVGKNVKVLNTGYGMWSAEYENVDADIEVYTEGRITPEGALRVLENRLRRMRTALNKLVPVALLLLSGCNSAESTHNIAYKLDRKASVVCFSGGKEILNTHSKGFVQHSGPGWFFQDARTGRLITVMGDCVARSE